MQNLPEYVPAGKSSPRTPAIAERKLISIIAPVLNEEENIEIFYNVVSQVMETEAGRYDFELVFTDNHSSDGSFEKLRAVAARDPRVRAYRFSRNFGYQRSIYTGLMLARGAAAIELDCDLQDPPAVIHDFLRLWESGHLVVYGVRRSRKEAVLMNLVRSFFYYLVDKLSDYHLPRGAGDFRLIDRCIIEHLRQIKDPAIYLRGRVAAMGFSQVGIEYDRDRRTLGESKFHFRHNLRLALDAITSHSAVPLRLATYFGFAVTALTIAGIPLYLVTYLMSKTRWPAGFATLLFLSLGTLGILSLFLGIIGEYLGRLYEHVKTQPDLIIEQAVEPTLTAPAPPGEEAIAHTRVDQTSDRSRNPETATG